MDPRVESLTKREVEVLRGVFDRLTDKEIAARDGVAPQTVSNAIYNARTKLGGLDRRRAAELVAAARGWQASIRHTGPENTLAPAPPPQPNDPANHGGWQDGYRGHGASAPQSEGTVFVQTLSPQPPFGLPGQPARRNEHDMLARVSMLLSRTAFLVAATVALLWVYGRA